MSFERDVERYVEGLEGGGMEEVLGSVGGGREVEEAVGGGGGGGAMGGGPEGGELLTGAEVGVCVGVVVCALGRVCGG